MCEGEKLERGALDKPSAEITGGDSAQRPNNAYEEASFFSRITFRWAYKLMKLGRERTIEEIDLPALAKDELSADNCYLIEKIWNDELERVRTYNSIENQRKKTIKKPSLHRAFVMDFLKSMWKPQFFFLLESIAQIWQSLSMGYLLDAFSMETTNYQSQIDARYFWAGIMVLCGIVTLLCHHQVYFILWRKGLQLKTGAIAAIFSKSLRISAVGGGNDDSISTGKIVNIASNDVERFVYGTIFASYLFWGPAMSVAVLVIGLNLIGPAFACGYILLFLFIPLQFVLMKKFAKLRLNIATITDSRISLVGQAVSGARIMKMSGWEDQFTMRIANLRTKQVKEINRANKLRALNESIFYVTSMMVSIVIFLFHLKFGGTLSSSKVYTTISLVMSVQYYMAKFFSMGVMNLSESYVAVSRIQKFFECKDIVPITEGIGNQTSKLQKICSTEKAFALKKLTCYWDSRENGDMIERNVKRENDGSIEEKTCSCNNEIALHNISIDFNMAHLYCIIGPVGCGKSALLYALAGELKAFQGCIHRGHNLSISYAPQDPWIMNGTIKENIILGLTFNEEWYEKVIESCGLLFDFALFKNGDETLVGDRGVQCSGGQKARLGLARALYRDSEIMIFDDPLSAVDSKVGRQIFYTAIQDLCVKKGKCVILATHQHQYIGDATCVYMVKGKIEFVGSYNGCIEKSGGDLSKKMQATNKTAFEMKDSNKEEEEEEKPLRSVAEDNKKNDKIEHKEVSDSGTVKMDTWIAYARAMGGISTALLLVLLFASTQVMYLVTMAAIGDWAEKPASQQNFTSAAPIFLVFGGTTCILSLSRTYAFFFYTIRASSKLHDRMTKRVLRAKIEFFDLNPRGRILNRFSADVGSNDDQLPTTLLDFFVCGFIVAGGVTTATVVLPFSLLALPPLVLYFFRIRRIFLRTTRELKRFEGVSRSPIYAMLNEALCGVDTLRANSATNYFKNKFANIHDAYSRAYFSFIGSSRWLGFRIDFIMFCFTTICAFSAVIVDDWGVLNVKPSLLGLALSLLLHLAGTFQWAVRQSAEMVNQMICVERVVAYNNLPMEAALKTEEDEQRLDWPSEGRLDICGLSVRYRESLPLALTNVTFSVECGERVGVVGRTGCGKSTLVQALFRILEAEEGVVKVDGVDLSLLGLHKLRTKMSVIPQYPVLFSGCSIRENLDPFNKHTVEDIRKALSDVQMMDSIDELPYGLDSMVAEDGSNFSVGQRQLICAARAILWKNKILVLDEATANVDNRTDELLQKSVARSFSGSTIIAIAHRIETIINYDKIIVLGQGKVLEVGSPSDLLQRKGVFASMVDDTGEENAKKLRALALIQ